MQMRFTSLVLMSFLVGGACVRTTAWVKRGKHVLCVLQQSSVATTALAWKERRAVVLHLSLTTRGRGEVPAATVFGQRRMPGFAVGGHRPPDTHAQYQVCMLLRCKAS